jgi:AcrR family transcriptional regulator
MRITAQAKTATRQRILDAAVKLFHTKGFDATTTRDIAQLAGIASGTLFNYFATKETIVAELVGDALAVAREDLPAQTEPADSLGEELFRLVAGELRRLRPFRKFIGSIVETILSPLATNERTAAGDKLRALHLESVVELAHAHGARELSPVALQLYWTLYLGVLSFWSSDKSPKQEDSLALMDQSFRMFAQYLEGQGDK